MADETVSIKVGFTPDTAGNQKSIAEIQKVKQEVLDVQKAVKDTSSTKLEVSGPGGGGGFQPNKLRGVASMFGGGEIVGFVDDIGDALDGITQLGGNLSSLLNPATIGAGVAVAALALVIQDFAQGAQEQADAIKSVFEAQREVFDEIAGGATTADIQEQIAQLQFRRELEKQTLADATAAYQDYEKQIRESFGAFGEIILGFLRLIDPREEELNQQQQESQKNIDAATAKERAYNEALEQGLTAKADAKEAAEEQAKAAEKAARDQEAAQRKAEAAAEKAQREAEAAAKEQAQLRQQQQDMAIKNADAIKKINQGALDGIQDIQRKAKDAQLDGQNKLISDLNSLTQKANDDEIGAAIKANRAEEQALKEHQRTIKELLDKAADAEENAREQRNFLEFAKAQRDAQKELNKQPEQFKAGADDRRTAFEQEREDRLRALELARRDRNQAAGEEDAQRRTGIERALRDNQINKNRQLQQQQAAAQAEQATFQRHLQNMLSARGQFQNAEMQMLQGSLNALSGGGRPAPAAPSNTFNSSQTINNNTIAMTTIGTGTAVSALRAAGFGR